MRAGLPEALLKQDAACCAAAEHPYPHLVLSSRPPQGLVSLLQILAFPIKSHPEAIRTVAL
eukprot:15438392-Alexandrium_andersonii.AAC.1